MRYTTKAPNFDHFGQTANNTLFGSLHPTKFQAVFADDSVHSISYSIDPAVFTSWGTSPTATPSPPATTGNAER